MNALDRRVLLALQGLVLGLPLLLGGRPPWTLRLACPLILALLVITLRERRRRGGARAPGSAALAAFIMLALGTTVPLPPAALELLSPATAHLYAETLPGWPGGGGWATWRALAIDPYAAWLEVSRFSIGLGAFAVVVAYPWRATDEAQDPRRLVFARLFMTLLAGGVLVAVLGLFQRALGNRDIMWVSGVPAQGGRASGPFVNPNHFAAWLEMVIPAALAYFAAVSKRVRKRITLEAQAGRGLGVRLRRAWAAAVITHQQRLWTPLVAATALGTMGVAHVASGSRGGAAALLAGLGVAGAGIAANALPRGARLARWLPAAIILALLVASATSLARWAAVKGAEGGIDTVDVSLASRLAVSKLGTAVVHDHPLLGTGLGSWLQAFRPYQAPQVGSGIWDHAHDDYLELVAESGFVGAALVLLFVLAVVRAGRRSPDGDVRRRRSHHHHHHGARRPPGFEVPDWRAALRERALLRWGLAGGVAAILVHSLVDFGLRMPANLLALMIILGLVVLSGRRQLAGPAPGVGLLPILIAAAAAPLVANAVMARAGAAPLSPGDCLERADLLLAERGEAGRAEALALVRRALERAPADSAAHDALASVLGAGPDGDAALRRAIALDPSAVELRDRLALRLWARGERQEAAHELEQSMRRVPYLASHASLSAESDLAAPSAAQLLRALIVGDTMTTRLAVLEPEMADAIERSLDRALGAVPAGQARMAILDDLVTLREARGRWDEAAAVIRAEAGRSADLGPDLARAAGDYLKAHDYTAAEQTLLAALLRTPEQGALYRQLAVDIYAARGDFPTAEEVLKAGERSALDMLPVYDGVREVLTRRESKRVEDLVGPPAPSAVSLEFIP